jgi:hypothetical protein
MYSLAVLHQITAHRTHDHNILREKTRPLLDLFAALANPRGLDSSRESQKKSQSPLKSQSDSRQRVQQLGPGMKVMEDLAFGVGVVVIQATPDSARRILTAAPAVFPPTDFLRAARAALRARILPNWMNFFVSV